MIGLLAAMVFYIQATGFTFDPRLDREADLLRNDPQAGANVELPDFDVLGRRIPEGRTLLVHGGRCTSCSFAAFAPSRLSAKNLVVVVAFQGSPEELRLSTRSYPSNIYVISDNGRIASILNLVWTPRFFLLDQSQKMEWVQKDFMTLPYGVVYAR